jgi:hypothetical protein
MEVGKFMISFLRNIFDPHGVQGKWYVLAFSVTVLLTLSNIRPGCSVVLFPNSNPKCLSHNIALIYFGCDPIEWDLLR